MNLDYDRPLHPAPNLDFRTFQKSEACQKIKEIAGYYIPRYLEEQNLNDRFKEATRK